MIKIDKVGTIIQTDRKVQRPLPGSEKGKGFSLIMTRTKQIV